MKIAEAAKEKGRTEDLRKKEENEARLKLRKTYVDWALCVLEDLIPDLEGLTREALVARMASMVKVEPTIESKIQHSPRFMIERPYDSAKNIAFRMSELVGDADMYPKALSLLAYWQMQLIATRRATENPND